MPNGEAAGLRIGKGLVAVTALCLALAAPAQGCRPCARSSRTSPARRATAMGRATTSGNSMDTLKIAKSPFGGYIGVYHTPRNGQFSVKVATSVDLLHWTFQANLVANASQPTIHRLPQGAALVAYESHVNCGGASHCLGLRYYSTESALLNGAASRRVILPRKLSSCAEGTPSIFTAKPDLSEIDIGFHYFSGCRVDRQARGQLRNFSPSTWAPLTTPSMDAAILGAGASPDGHIGDRDGNFYDGAYQRLYEGQIAPLTSWRASSWWARRRRSSRSARTGARAASPTPRTRPWRCPTGSPASS